MSLLGPVQRTIRRVMRRALASSPRDLRFALIRRLIDCESDPDPRLTFEIAASRDDLEACFRILHDAYVASGYMLPSPSGLRVTRWHALPTTTTLCAKFDGRVVGTISIVREGVFGFPLQSTFDLSAVRARGGQIAEISALAIDPAFRQTGGQVLFPLMKFMHSYCRERFDTRHLVIAVNPSTIELYEALLFFERLEQAQVDRYAFANGAPAVGATLDLAQAKRRFAEEYGQRARRRNLHHYFFEAKIPGIRMPSRALHLTNDPVLTPRLLDYFFNRKTDVFAQLDTRQRLLLHSVYSEPAFADVLPSVDAWTLEQVRLRKHPRFTFRCPATIWAPDTGSMPLTIVDCSLEGCRAETEAPLPVGTVGNIDVELGPGLHSSMRATVMRSQHATDATQIGLHLPHPDSTWKAFVQAMHSSITIADLARVRITAAEARPLAAMRRQASTVAA